MIFNYLFIGICSAIIIVLIIWRFPKWQTKKLKDIKKKEKWKVENEFRKTLTPIIVGLVSALAVIIGIFLTWEKFYRSGEEQRHTQENIKNDQIYSQYTEAIKLLSDDKTTKKIGAIYALEQIAEKYPDYLRMVLNFLTAFVKNSEYFKYHNKEGKIRITEVSKKLRVIYGNKEDTAQKAREIYQIFEEIELFPEVQEALKVIGRIRYNYIEAGI